MRSDIAPGGVFPDYALPDHTETVRSLSEIQGRDPMILTLPGLREAWDAGDWSLFHGWDRRSRETLAAT